MNEETAIMRLIQFEASKRGNIRLWRNESGLFYAPNGARVKAGLCKGSSDLIGLRSVLITREMVGTFVGQFMAVEVKTPEGRLTDEQKKYLDTINALGGYGRVFESVEQCDF